MQTYRSTCKLTPEIIREYHDATGKLLDAALTILVMLLAACFLLPFISPYIAYQPGHASRSVITMAIFPFAAVGLIFNKYVLPCIHRIFLRAALRDNEKRFHTSIPTLESHIESNAIITRCLENKTEECSPIYGKTVVQTDHYIFIRCNRSHLAIFSIADFSEEVLSDLLTTLSEYGAEIMPK